MPVAKESANDLWLSQAKKIGDRNFEVTNLPPGAFWMVVRAVPDNEADDSSLNPIAWGATKRAALRRSSGSRTETLRMEKCSGCEICQIAIPRLVGEKLCENFFGSCQQ